MVNKIYPQFPEKYDNNMTEEERETLRHEIPTTFYCPAGTTNPLNNLGIMKCFN
jgi:hypothetical protein